MTSSGFVALAGRPNAGKSTITNALVGEKVTIVSNRPQTTRRAVRGVVTREEVQLVLTDLPGVQRPLDRLTARMQRLVERQLADSDAVLLVINGEEGVGPGDRFIASLLRGSRSPVVAAVNKIDRLGRGQVAATLADVADLGVATEIVPVSATTGEGLPVLLGQLSLLMPDGPFLYPSESRTDQPLAIQMAERIREQVIVRTRKELPHAVEVEIEEIVNEAGAAVVRAAIIVDTESQKAIVVGRGGRMIKAIGTDARREINMVYGERVHLDLRVRARGGWREDDRMLDRLGLD